MYLWTEVNNVTIPQSVAWTKRKLRIRSKTSSRRDISDARKIWSIVPNFGAYVVRRTWVEAALQIVYLQNVFLVRRQALIQAWREIYEYQNCNGGQYQDRRRRSPSMFGRAEWTWSRMIVELRQAMRCCCWKPRTKYKSDKSRDKYREREAGGALGCRYLTGRAKKSWDRRFGLRAQYCVWTWVKYEDLDFFERVDRRSFRKGCASSTYVGSAQRREGASMNWGNSLKTYSWVDTMPLSTPIDKSLTMR